MANTNSAALQRDLFTAMGGKIPIEEISPIVQNYEIAASGLAKVALNIAGGNGFGDVSLPVRKKAEFILQEAARICAQAQGKHS